MADVSARRFLRVFYALISGALLLTGLVNLLVDPLGIFGMPIYEGINAKKTQYGKYLRMVKPHVVRVLRPAGLILGTSRAEYLDPEHPGWSAAARPVYNMAIVSSRMHEVLLNLQHAQAQHPLKQVVLLLDTFMFDANVQTEAGFDEARLDPVAGPRLNLAWVGDIVNSLLSFDSLSESITTIRAQGRPSRDVYLANGMRDLDAFQNVVDQAGGHRNLFLSMVRPAEPSHGSRNANPNKPYDDFRALLEFCRTEGIDLRLAISPLHAHMVAYHWQNFGRDGFENWTRRIVSVVSEVTRHAPDSWWCPVWDFSGFNSITLEPIPLKGDASTKMVWYWEGSHFKTRTGNLMLDRIFGYQSEDLLAHPDFGVQIDTTNMEDHLLSIRAGHLSYMRTHQEDVEEVSRILGNGIVDTFPAPEN